MRTARSGTSRTRVTAIANGNTQGLSTDGLITVLAATGHRAEVRVKERQPSARGDRKTETLLRLRAIVVMVIPLYGLWNVQRPRRIHVPLCP